MLGISAGSDGIFEDASGESKDGCACCGIRPDVWVTKYLEWTFRSSFALVLCSTALGFFSLTLIFAGLILWGGRRRPECIWINGEDFGKSANQFGDAYMLSWTTFSTVVSSMGASTLVQVPRFCLTLLSRDTDRYIHR